MAGDTSAASLALNQRFLHEHPLQAAQHLERLPVAAASAVLAAQSGPVLARVWELLSADSATALFTRLPVSAQRLLLQQLAPTDSTALLLRLEQADRNAALDLLDDVSAGELRDLMDYPADAAGRLMDPHFISLQARMPVREVLNRLRQAKPRALRELFVLDAEGRPLGRVSVQDIAIADPDTTLLEIMRPHAVSVSDLTPREEVLELLEQHQLSELPVVDFSGRLIGVIRHTFLMQAMQEETSLDIQTMVGVSKEERALSGVGFAVAKRLPWLQINLLTAFLASAVVGIFESTIAQFTALAVLLPVVAGQSGNAGAQALAVTMRGLVLREIGVRHWPRVVMKEVYVGLLNGLAIAATTALGVYVWSRSLGLALVIAIAMVLSMIAAGFAGAFIPIALRRFGQDPAQSSSIILTTVTDVTGFFSFLGIATLLAALL